MKQVKIIFAQCLTKEKMVDPEKKLFGGQKLPERIMAKPELIRQSGIVKIFCIGESESHAAGPGSQLFHLSDQFGKTSGNSADRLIGENVMIEENSHFTSSPFPSDNAADSGHDLSNRRRAAA